MQRTRAARDFHLNRYSLARDFYLDEFAVSATAARHGIKINLSPESQEAANLQRLVSSVLQPLRNEINARRTSAELDEIPIIVLSGYRPPEVNRLVGGSPRSAHLEGRAADIRVPGMHPDEIMQILWENSTGRTHRVSPDRQRDRGIWPLDQAIEEFGQWVHVAVSRAGHDHRLSFLQAVKLGDAVTHYIPWRPAHYD